MATSVESNGQRPPSPSPSQSSSSSSASSEAGSDNKSHNSGSDDNGSAERKVDPYGFERSDDFDFETYEQFMSSYLSILARRAARWKDTYEDKRKISRSRKLKRFCRKGIPGDLRPDVWMLASGASRRKAEDPNRYKTLLSQRADPSVTDTILLDIHRTFPENVYFNALSDPQSLRKPLQNVLEAISISNPHVGYCQVR
ncbi:growth hormone-regulated tbc protein 1 [Plakobranchus ocellatus]|uniref:Growth hormone-regulated tbc protein 1 n=1 Tax=Plakobranchus ocellatus TaxID=259542 RepID=A0AAV4DZZ6_9GAST|nr:growth hormone-regulated tbc protein 1 [Plakobranchus ocellatus]